MAKGVSVTFKKENLTFHKLDPGDKSHEAMYSMLMLQLLGAVGQFECALIK
ncbi:hypothetical protein J2W28_004481 [Variovorax boronicumulans]|nr:hypothetical protein [Variovorax boronicumulans]MDQ0005319.1 hypothetical protein [Variovorax boronicumulans]